jgi:hypothetical protein
MVSSMVKEKVKVETISRIARRKKLAALGLAALLVAPASVACDKEDRPEVNDIEEGVEEGADEVGEQVEEGAEENNDEN